MRYLKLGIAALTVVGLLSLCGSPEQRFDSMSICEETGTRLPTEELARGAAAIVVAHLQEEIAAYEAAKDADPSVSDDRQYYRKYESTDDFLAQNPECCRTGSWEAMRKTWVRRPDWRISANDLGELPLAVDIEYRQTTYASSPDWNAAVYVNACGEAPKGMSNPLMTYAKNRRNDIHPEWHKATGYVSPDARDER